MYSDFVKEKHKSTNNCDASSNVKNKRPPKSGQKFRRQGQGRMEDITEKVKTMARTKAEE